MFEKIMVPVDLAHESRLARALSAAADLAKHWGIPVCYVGVASSAPGAVAHSPAEFAEKLAALGRREAERHGIEVTPEPVITADPTADLEDGLLGAVERTGADLVVMASHVPGLAEHLWPSHGGSIAAHAGVSVLIVRTA